MRQPRKIQRKSDTWCGKCLLDVVLNGKHNGFFQGNQINAVHHPEQERPIKNRTWLKKPHFSGRKQA